VSRLDVQWARVDQEFAQRHVLQQLGGRLKILRPVVQEVTDGDGALRTVVQSLFLFDPAGELDDVELSVAGHECVFRTIHENEEG